MVVEKIKIGVGPRVGGREYSGCIRVGFQIRLQLWTVAVPLFHCYQMNVDE